MSDSFKIETNGKHKVPWMPVVGVLWGLLIGLFVWTAQRELSRSESRIEMLEQNSKNSITLETRDEDRKLIEDIRQEQIRQGKLLAVIADRMKVREQP